jgi:hypothetical protein
LLSGVNGVELLIPSYAIELPEGVANTASFHATRAPYSLSRGPRADATLNRTRTRATEISSYVKSQELRPPRRRFSSRPWSEARRESATP